MDELPPMGMVIEALLLGFLVPGLVTAIVLEGLGRYGPPGERGELLGGALSLTLGFMAGYVALRWPPVVPADCWHWLPWLVVLASGVAVLSPKNGLGAWAGRMLVALLSARLLVPDWPELAALRGLWLAGLVAAIVGYWWVLDRASRTGGTIVPCVGLAIVALATSMVLAEAGSAKFAQLAGMPLAVVAVLTVFARRWPERRFLLGAIPGLAVLLPGLLLEGSLYTYSDVPKMAYLLIALAPLGLAVPGGESGGRRGWMRLVLVLVPAVAGLAIAHLAQGEAS